MIKELGMAALLSTSLNATDISLEDTKKAFESNSTFAKSLSSDITRILTFTPFINHRVSNCF